MKKYRQAARTQTHMRMLKHMKSVNNEKQTHARSKRRTYIHIEPRYDGYKQTRYIAEYARTRNTSNVEYIRMTNAINIFNEDAKELHAANAPYHKYIPMPAPPKIPKTAPEDMNNTHIYITDRKRAKCIIYKDGKPIHAGVFIRIIEINDDEAHIYLQRNDRRCEVKFHTIDEDIHGYTQAQLKKLGVEIYTL